LRNRTFALVTLTYQPAVTRKRVLSCWHMSRRPSGVARPIGVDRGMGPRTAWRRASSRSKRRSAAWVFGRLRWRVRRDRRQPPAQGMR